MSRKPGIARQWYDDHPDCYDYEYINISTDKGGKKFRPPKYFDKLYDVDEPEKSAELKAIRKKMAEDLSALSCLILLFLIWNFLPLKSVPRRIN